MATRRVRDVFEWRDLQSLWNVTRTEFWWRVSPVSKGVISFLADNWDELEQRVREVIQLCLEAGH